MENKKYKVVIAQSGKLDVKEKKKYILQQFKYREYAENFSKQIKKAVLALDTLPTGYNTTGFRYRGYDIYMKPCESYLLFYTVDEAVKTVTVLRVMQDGMDWQYIINRWLRENAQDIQKDYSDRQYSNRLGTACFYVR